MSIGKLLPQFPVPDSWHLLVNEPDDSFAGSIFAVQKNLSDEIIRRLKVNYIGLRYHGALNKYDDIEIRMSFMDITGQENCSTEFKYIFPLFQAGLHSAGLALEYNKQCFHKLYSSGEHLADINWIGRSSASEEVLRAVRVGGHEGDSALLSRCFAFSGSMPECDMDTLYSDDRHIRLVQNRSHLFGRQKLANQNLEGGNLYSMSLFLPITSQEATRQPFHLVRLPPTKKITTSLRVEQCLDI